MSNLYSGQVIEIKKGLVIDHSGILVATDKGWGVVHNSQKAGQVELCSLEDFLEGSLLQVSTRYNSTLHPTEVTRQAIRAIGRKWTPFYNCQHFVNEACGLAPKSHDLRMLGLFSVFLLVYFARAR